MTSQQKYENDNLRMLGAEQKVAMETKEVEREGAHPNEF